MTKYLLHSNIRTCRIQTIISNQYYYSLDVSKNNVFTDNELCLSTNNRTRWFNNIYEFNVIPPVHDLLFINKYISQGTYVCSIRHSSITKITNIQYILTEILSSYSLSQNYPNPFNPVTKINFDIPRWRGAGGWTTTLLVYDVMGREVQTLVNESLKPGTYETSFDGLQLTSGVYFYKITAGDFSETKKMLILK